MIFEVDRQNFRTARTHEPAPAALAPGEVRLAVERFAFTTNNITYALAGDMLDYWGFFPAEQPWGRLPAIGVAAVVESANPDIAEGGRFFGFYPMATQLIVAAEARRDGGFRDVGPHRANHAATYTDFRDIGRDESWDRDRVDQYLLLWGMFMTSFLVDDQLGDREFNGATQTLITSASSKTSISLASCVARRPGIRAIGVTSERNRAFVSELGLYDEVITYDQVGQLDAEIRSGMVDMAGNPTVRAAIHDHFNENLAFSVSVGATHWESQQVTAEPLAGPQPEFFFAPAQRAKRVQDWGAAELDLRIADAYQNMVDNSSSWLNIEHRQGPEGIHSTYTNLLEGRADPATGFICSMHVEQLD